MNASETMENFETTVAPEMPEISLEEVDAIARQMGAKIGNALEI